MTFHFHIAVVIEKDYYLKLFEARYENSVFALAWRSHVHFMFHNFPNGVQDGLHNQISICSKIYELSTKWSKNCK